MRSGIEPMSPGPLANTLHTGPMSRSMENDIYKFQVDILSLPRVVFIAQLLNFDIKFGFFYWGGHFKMCLII